MIAALIPRGPYVVALMVALGTLCYWQTKRLWAAEQSNRELSSHVQSFTEATRQHGTAIAGITDRATAAAVTVGKAADDGCLDRAVPRDVLDAIRVHDGPARPARAG